MHLQYDRPAAILAQLKQRLNICPELTSVIRSNQIEQTGTLGLGSLKRQELKLWTQGHERRYIYVQN